MAIADPNEKLVAAIAILGRPTVDDGYTKGGYDITGAHGVIRELYPSWDPSARTQWSRRPYPWDDAELAKWFAKKTNNAGLPPPIEARWIWWTKQLGRNRFKEHVDMVPAWGLSKGAFWPHGNGESAPPDAFVFVDGRYSPCMENEWPGSKDSYYHGLPGFNVLALVAMANHLSVG